MSTLIQDLRYAIRTFARSPVFTLVAVLTLGLGIGANTGVFSVVDAVLLEPLPYDEPDRIALVWTNFGPDLPQNWVSGPELVEMRQLNRSFDGIGAVVPTTANVTGRGEPEEVATGLVSGSLFRVLRVRPELGRLIEPSDDRHGAELVAVLSYGYWQRRFGGTKDVLGQTIRADGQPFTVVGVLPESFGILHPDAQFPERVELWAPLAPIISIYFGAADYEQLPRGSHFLRAFGRLEPGITLEQAQDDMDRVAGAMHEKSPDYYDFEGWGITVLSLHEDLVEDVKPALLVLLGAVGFVLLIACVNVANLLLARAAAREREIAVRTALGAGRLRLLRQLLTESTLLAVLGGVVGLLVAVGLVRALVVLAPARLPRVAAVGIDGGVLAFTLGVALLTGVLFGLAPALYGLRQDLARSFHQGSKGGTGGAGGSRTRGILVVAEVALAMVLLVGAALMLKSFGRLLDTDPGYDPDNLLTLRISLPADKSEEEALAFFDELLERVGALPGVSSVGTISQLPLSGSYSSGTTRVDESEALPEDQQSIEADRRQVSAGYFRTMGVELLRGRGFTVADRADSPPVAIVDEELVRRFWPGEDPLGKHVAINRDDDGNLIWRRVVGVVRHSKHYDLGTVGREQVYFPYRQMPMNSMYLAVRTSLDPLSLVPAVRSQVQAIDPDQPLADVRSMESRVAASLSQPRFSLLLLGAFGVLALALAAVGIYGVLAYSVTQRRQEIGVRMALGAAGPAVLRLVLGQGLLRAVAGLVLGIVLALGLTRLMAGMLYGVEPTDPWTYLGVALLLAAVAAVACALPAVRATRVAPAEVLRAE